MSSRQCTICKKNKPKDKYSQTQWKKYDRKCTDCYKPASTSAPSAPPTPTAPLVLYTKQISDLGAPEYRLYFCEDGHPISPFHDIPLWHDRAAGVANMVVEIPLGTRAKLEISRDQLLNPIKQDVKKGALRYVHDPYPFNYGAFPQTWESPFVVDRDTKAKGDNDPLDVVEISGRPRKTGDVVPVKILGTWAMIDEGETDWKILTIDAGDPLAAQWKGHGDIPKEIVTKVFTFLRDYKIPDGNPPNQFAFNGELKDREFALRVTEDIHEQWKALVNGANVDKHSISLTALRNGRKVGASDAENIVLDQFKAYLKVK